MLSYAAFRARWIDAEKEALFAAAQTHWQVQDYINIAVASNSVVPLSAGSKQAKQLLIALEVLTPERADVIFAA